MYVYIYICVCVCVCVCVYIHEIMAKCRKMHMRAFYYSIYDMNYRQIRAYYEIQPINNARSTIAVLL